MGGRIRRLTIEENNRNVALSGIRKWAKVEGKTATILSLKEKKVLPNTIIFTAKVRLKKRR